MISLGLGWWLRQHWRGVVIATGATFTGLAVLTLAAGTLLLTGPPPQQSNDGPDCDPSLNAPTAPGQPAQPAPTSHSGAGQVGPDQRAAAATIISVGQGMQVPARGWLVAVATALQESGLRNVTNGDRDSLGLFQQRPSQGWGTPAQIMDPTYAARAFYTHLMAIPGWQDLPVTVAAQTVQRSALPTAYAQWTSLAAALVKTLAGDAAAAALSSCAPADPAVALPEGVARTVIAYAMAQLGHPYQWGATGQNGAYDCSGLMLRAFATAHITLPRVARDQFQAGAHLPVSQAQPGDLLFWATNPASPATIHHVALYLGNGQIVEAPTTGIPVRVRTLKPAEPELVPTATRLAHLDAPPQ
jgi:cell wall-associated NlpC family hydrolase